MKESLVSRQILNSSSKMSSNEDNFCQKAGKLASTNFCRSFHSLTVGCLPVLAYAWNARIIFDSFEILSQRAAGKSNEPYDQRNAGITETL